MMHSALIIQKPQKGQCLSPTPDPKDCQSQGIGMQIEDFIQDLVNPEGIGVQIKEALYMVKDSQLQQDHHWNKDELMPFSHDPLRKYLTIVLHGKVTAYKLIQIMQILNPMIDTMKPQQKAQEL